MTAIPSIVAPRAGRRRSSRRRDSPCRSSARRDSRCEPASRTCSHRRTNSRTCSRCESRARQIDVVEARPREIGVMDVQSMLLTFDRIALLRRRGTGSPCGLAAYWSMRFSISGRKWAIRPWIGHAAASPSAQMVWPSTCLVTSSSMSISRFSRPALGHAGHHPPHPAGALAARRALAAALVLVEIGEPRDRA